VADGDCALRVSWFDATGEGNVTYDLYRDTISPPTPPELASGLTVLEFLDTAVDYGESRAYQVVATDSCADPGPQSVANDPSGSVAVEDSTPPDLNGEAATYDGTVPGDCTVRLSALVTADCADLTDISILRDTIDPPAVVAAPGAALPYDDAVPSDGIYYYRIRVEDEASNTRESATLPVTVDNCSMVCLYRSDVADRTTLDPAVVYQTPRDPVTDIGLQGVAYQCPWFPGDVDPAVVGNGMDLVIYQVDTFSKGVRIERQGSDLGISF
jgi:hypothetical protein